MPYKFSIAQVNRRRVDGVITGFYIVVRCEKIDGAGNVSAESELGWFAPKGDFVPWPPTKPQGKAYIKSYLQAKPVGSGITRAAAMKARAVVVSDEPDPQFIGEEIEESS